MSASYRGDLAVNDTHRTSEAAPQSKSSTRSANPPTRIGRIGVEDRLGDDPVAESLIPYLISAIETAAR